MLYDAKCPVCGKLNKDMYLEETEGRFVCDKCGSEIEIPRFKKPKRIPIYDSRTLVALINNHWSWQIRPVLPSEIITEDTTAFLLLCRKSQPHKSSRKNTKPRYHREKGGNLTTMHFKDGDVPIKWVCLNCRSIIVGFQGEDGLTRIKCPHCGTVTVSKLISRRHVQVDVFAPQGQELLRSN